MQNASKHAPKATGIRITISEHAAQLRVEVRDDGPGFDARRAAPGAGLTNMRDRVAVLGGRLRIDARPGAGTRVLLTFPLDLPELPACARAGSAASA